MGTTSEWVQVLLAGGFWGGFMAWVFARRRASANLKRWHIVDVLMWALAGLWFSLVTTLRWRSFHRPIVFVTVAAIAGVLLVGWFRRKDNPLRLNPPSS
jgi:hypothetical protein